MNAKKAKLVNLTPHLLVVAGVAIPPSGGVARVAVATEPAGEINGIPVVQTVYGSDVAGLPAPDGESIFIVSYLVLCALRAKGVERDDVVAPDTTPASAIRDRDGILTGVRRFQR